jgi:hypothetical protein
LKPPKTRISDQLPIETDFQQPAVVPLRQLLQKKLIEEFGDHPMIAVKDPRISATFPLWHSVLTEMGYTIKTILAIRSASAILKSNLKLTPLPLYSWRRWYLRHILGIRYFTRDVFTCQFDYDHLMRQPVDYAKEKAVELGLPMPDPAAATHHLSSQLYHHQPDDTGTGDAWIDQVDSEFRAGRLDPEEYLRYRRTASLFMEELWEFDTYIKTRQAQEAASERAAAASPSPRDPAQPTMQQWFQEHQRLRAVLQQGGRFDVEAKPDGSINIKRLPQS